MCVKVGRFTQTDITTDWRRKRNSTIEGAVNVLKPFSNIKPHSVKRQVIALCYSPTCSWASPLHSGLEENKDTWDVPTLWDLGWVINIKTYWETRPVGCGLFACAWVLILKNPFGSQHWQAHRCKSHMACVHASICLYSSVLPSSDHFLCQLQWLINVSKIFVSCRLFYKQTIQKIAILQVKMCLDFYGKTDKSWNSPLVWRIKIHKTCRGDKLKEKPT